MHIQLAPFSFLGEPSFVVVVVVFPLSDRGCLANMFVVIKSIMGAGPLLGRNSREDSLLHHPILLGMKQAFTMGLFLSLFS